MAELWDTGGTIDQQVHSRGYGVVHYGSDAALPVRFYMRDVKLTIESEKRGYPVYDQKPYIQIHHVGGKDITDRPIKDEDKLRFSRHWEAFQKGMTEPDIGLPLAQWPQLDRTDVERMKGFGVTTVEQLAAMSDEGLQRIGTGSRALKEKAAQFLVIANESAHQNQLADELKKRDEQLISLQAQIAELQAAAKPRRRKKEPEKNEIQVNEGEQVG